MTARLILLLLLCVPAAACAESHPPVGAAVPDAGLSPHPDGGVPGECLPGEANLRGETPLGPASDFVFAVADATHDGSCTGTVLTVVVSEVPPGRFDPPRPSLMAWVHLVDLDVFHIGETVEQPSLVVMSVLTDDPSEERVEGLGHLVVEPLELGSSGVLIHVELYGAGWSVTGTIQATYCSSSICI